MSTQDPVRAAYIAAVQASASAEYFVEEAGSGRFQARNPAQGLVSRFAAEGVRIASTSTERPFSAEIALVRHGCEGDLRAVSPARPDDASDTRVDYERGEVLEWYENGPLGIEQGIVIDSPPACETDSSTVVIDLSVSGDLEPVSRGDGASVDLVDSSGRIALRYTDLFVTDATGRQLPARVDAENGLLTISVSAEGAAYPLMIDPLFSALEQKLVAPLGGANGSFGMSVAISGDTAVVGVPNDFGYYNGAVRVFVRSNGAWSQQATFYGEGGDYFGGAVAIDGDTIVVGAPNDDDFSTNAGAAHIYTRNNGVWSYGGQILPSGLYPVSHFGTCVAIDGDLVVVTDPYAYSIWIGGGLVYPYHRNGNNWDAWPVVVSNNVAGSAKFGASVAVDGPWVVAGAPDEHSVYFIHPHAGGYWYDKFTGAWGQHLGQQVAISGDTGAAAEGAQIKLYAYNGISWVPSGITLTPAPATGWEISALALQGDALLVGMKYDDTLAIDAGSAFLFERTQGVWAQTAQLTAFDSAANDWFGTSVDLDGTTAIVGAPGDDDLGMDSGSAYVFGPSKALGLQCFGAADCASGFCVDGVCCDSACGGGASDCQACSIAMGAVADGTCTIAPPGPVCRPSTGVCDPAEACNGASGSCPADVLAPAGTVCRAAAGVCDSAETCNGVAGSCPPDVFSPSTTVCRAAVGNCDFAEKCTGSSIACPGDIVKAAGVACRASAGVCDPAEACNGVSGSCPADVLTPAGTVCRAAVGTCDVAETCSGAAAACPADALKPGGEVCRPSAGACDVAETCSGASGVCPLDQLAAPGVVCRSSGGACDPAELCDGTMPQCPVDSVDPAGSVCRPAAGLCDAVEVCDGTGKGCGPDLAAPAGSVCRASTGSCDPAEACDGVSDSCPADALAPPGTLCRAAVGTCDVAETCNGAAAACPADALKPGGEVCRPSAGACDVAETCNGASGVCPLDQLAAPGLVCRPSGGACDPAEICNGIGPQCPFDSIEPAGTICRPAAGVCDLAEACDGVIGSCPDDILAPDGTACEDGTCQDGICAGQGAGGGGAGGGTSNTGAAGTGGAGAGGGGGVSNTGGAGAGGGGGVSNTGGAGAGGGGGASNTGGAGGGGGASSGGGTSDAGEAGHGGEPSDTGDAGHGGEPAGTGQSQTDEPGETPSCACAVPGSSSGTRAPVPQLSLLLALAALRLLRRSREAISRGGGGRSTARSLPRSRRGRTVG